jgi:hypothetical protein
MPYIGRGPGFGVRSRFIYTATAGQTTFSGNDDAGISLAYTDTLYMDVYQNGVLLVPATDYAATTGTSVVLVQGASADDTLELLVHDIFSVADSVSKKDGGAFSGNLSATDITATATLNAQGDTAAGDNAAIGYTAAEGLILTGQGSTDDITIKNDADTTVLNVATGGTDVEISAGNLLFGTADKGIYLGVTTATAANLLDDYEEGTWTAAVTTGVTLSQSAGTYTKIGRQVTVSGAFNVGSVSSPSGGSITGLPFTSGSGTGFSTAGSIWLNTINNQEGKTLQIRMDQNTNNVVFTDLAGGNAGGASSYLKANSVINISLTYFTA